MLLLILPVSLPTAGTTPKPRSHNTEVNSFYRTGWQRVNPDGNRKLTIWHPVRRILEPRFVGNVDVFGYRCANYPNAVTYLGDPVVWILQNPSCTNQVIIFHLVNMEHRVQSYTVVGFQYT